MNDALSGQYRQEPCILLDVVIDALPGRQAALAALLLETQRQSQQETGCLIYRFGQDLADSSRFVLCELWQSEADLAAHKQGQPFGAFIAALPELGKVASSKALAGALHPYQPPRTRT